MTTFVLLTFLFISYNYCQPYPNIAYPFSPLSASDSLNLPQQGAKVSVSADGLSFAFSGPNNNRGLGAIWVFDFDASTGNFTQQGSALVGSGTMIFDDSEIKTIGASATASEGYGLALSGDGLTCAAGGIFDGFIGAVWVFKRSAKGSPWIQDGPKIQVPGNYNCRRCCC